MKRRLNLFTVLTIFLLSFNLVTHSQGCLPEGIAFTSQSQIDNFQTNFPDCTEIEGTVSIHSFNGSDITNLDGLNVVTSIEGWLTIENNDSLVSLSGLNNISEVDGHVVIIENNNLTNLTGLENLAYMNGDLVVSYNINLSSLEGLNQLNHIYEDFRISNNTQLISLEGIEALTMVTGDIFLNSNQNLININALSNLLSINGDISVMSNDNLSSLEGLENIEATTILGLTIMGNPNLSDCAIQSICDFLEAPGGTINILNNAPTCNSIEEVEEACFVSTNEISDPEKKIQIFPNPAKDEITILCPSEIKINEVCIFNQTGKKLVCKKDGETTIYISELEPGLYIVEIKTNSGNYREKLVIQ